jgi:cell division protein FtsI/penicillin-binding protein 2
MGQVITHNNGTGKHALPLIPGIKVYGKTGTAENPHGEDHAWFIGWMNYNEKNYSIVVLLENAGSGGGVAAPVAREVFTDIVKVNQLVSK